jgi:hypothetical protein
MNALLWIFQSILALLYLAGGAYKTFGFDEVAKLMPALSRNGWAAVGVVEMVGAVLLIFPWAAGRLRFLTPLAAAVLTVETAALAAVYASYSTKPSVENPLMWAVPMGVMAGIVALGRRRRE